MYFIYYSTKFLALFNLIVSLTLALALIYSYTQYKNNFLLLYDPEFTFIIGFTTALFLMSVHFVYGIIAITKKKMYILSFFIIISFIWGSLWILFGDSARKTIPMVVGQNCQSNPYYSTIQSYAQNAFNTLCVTCPCYFPLSNNSKAYSQNDMAIIKNKAPLISLNDQSLASSVFKCPGWNNSLFDDGEYLFRILQQQFQCTGWCNNSDNLYFRFTNINRGVPLGSCYDIVSKTSLFVGFLIEMIMYLQGMVILIGMGFGICLVCAIKKQKEENEVIEIFSTQKDII